ncbi:acyloxyacyl hydrolase [Aerophototrophica crusticola]|uniref:Acyloxyacyl hydrolase n=1 Tax=Aerophototrophica crusticola TaxID=1709002 RepID=A0A858R5I4_9PROT|nr:acyloxyacyl hydrolase [Rhodospirillaceae bacterium B3]
MKPAARVMLLAACLTTGTLAAAEAQAAQPALVSFGAGKFDTSDNDPKNSATDFRLEYRFGDDTDLIDFGSGIALRPWVGVELTTDGMKYALGGLLLDIPIGPLVITPSFGAGAFYRGAGKDLGSWVEFRSTIEVGYRFDNGMRISAAYGHISNAGITDDNPGAEIGTVYLHIPADLLF